MVKNPPANRADPLVGRSHNVGNGNQLQYSCLGNAMDREHGVLMLMRLKQLSN